MSLAVYNSYWVAHTSAQKITKTTKNVDILLLIRH